MDVKQEAQKTGDIEAELTAFRSALSNHLAYGAAYYPYLNSTISYVETADTGITIAHKDAAGVALELDTKTLDTIKANNGALYAAIKQKTARIGVKLPPSAAVAGIYVQTDQSRGVWKAPANVGVSAVLGPAIKFDNLIQDGMNMTVHGKAINAIRNSLQGAAPLSGARGPWLETSNEWRYISVRRFSISWKNQ